MRTIVINNPGPQGSTGPQGVAGPSGSTQPFNNVSGSIWATTSSLQISGSFLVSGSSTFTNIGPAIFSGSATITGPTTMSSAIVSGDVTVLGTASINVLQINTTINSTGSNTLGDAANDTQTLYGTVVIPTGSLTVSGSARITSSLNVGGDTTLSRLGVGNGISSWMNSGTIVATDTYFSKVTAGGSDGGLTLVGTPTVNSIYTGTGQGYDSANNLAISTYNGGRTWMYISSSGNVGIGTASPKAKVHISSTVVGGFPTLGIIDTKTSLFTTDSSNNYGLLFGTNGANGFSWIQSQRVDGTATAYPIMLNPQGGNIVIGSILDAGYKLDVNGNSRIKGTGATSATTALRVENSSASPSLVVLDNGYVGINTGSAQYNLDVNGTARVQNISYIGPSQLRPFGSSIAVDPTGGNLAIIPSNTTNTLVDSTGAVFIRSNTIGTTANLYTLCSIQTVFSPTSGTGVNNNLVIHPIINQTGGANGITRGLYINPTLTAASDFRAIETTAGNVLLGSNFIWDNTNSRLGINIASPNQTLEVWGTGYVSGRVGIGSSYPLSTVSLQVTGQLTGGVISYGVRQSGYVQTDTTLQGVGFGNQLNKQSVNTLSTYYNYLAYGGGVVSGTVTNQMGYAVTSNLTNATNNYAFHSELASGSGNWNLYMNGGALNYLSGSLLIGTNTDSGFKLDVNGTTRIKGTGTTDATFPLKVQNNSGTDLLTVSDVGFIRIAGPISSASPSTVYTVGVGGFYRTGAGTEGLDVGRSGTTTMTLFSGTATLKVFNNTGVSINSTTLNASAVLQADSTTAGFLPPRMTNAQRVAISTPAVGLMVYCTDATEGLYIYKSTGWTFIV